MSVLTLLKKETSGTESGRLVHSQNCFKQSHSSVQKTFNIPDKAESACSSPRHQDVGSLECSSLQMLTMFISSDKYKSRFLWKLMKRQMIVKGKAN